jgi:hypothetical protein
MLRLIRGLFRPRVPVRICVDAAEMRLKNQRALGKKTESERWEARMRSLAAEWKRRHTEGLGQAAIDLEEAIDDLTKKREG